MIVFVGANGTVCWRIRRISVDEKALTCLTDGHRITYQLATDATHATALQSAAAHSQSLVGTLRFLAQIDL